MLNTAEQFFKQLEKSQHPLIVFPTDWQGDAVSSALALFLFLKKINKEVAMAADPSAKKEVWSFLLSKVDLKSELSDLRKFIISLNISQTKVSQIKYHTEEQKINFIITPKNGYFKPEDISTADSGFKYDLIITLGATDQESLGKIYEANIDFFYKTSVINIDCQSSNEEFGQINIIDINSLTISEILFNLFQEKHPDLIDEDIATCLLAGIISGTKNFRIPNLNPKTLLDTSALIALGGRREEIIEKLYHSRNFKTLKLWGRVLSNLNTSLNGQLVWSLVKYDDFKQSEALEDSLLDIIDELIINIPEAKIITIIFETSIKDTNKILFYSLKNVNALEVLKEYQVSGTAKIAQAELQGKLEEVSQNYLSDLEIKLKNIFK